MELEKIRKELRRYGSKEKAKVLQGFFKTGPGEYGEGDVFLGVKVPDVRRIAKAHRDLTRRNILKLLKSPIHEERLLALLILVSQFSEGDEPQQKKIYEFYLKHTKYTNNWDLVDLSAHYIVGPFLMNRSKKPLLTLARSKALWERRISIIATFHFIANGKFDTTLKIAAMLLKDEEDLIHKAVGWMLREVGKRDMAVEEKFLKQHYKKMPRTMLRYAIERFPERKRQAYLKSRM